MIDIDIQISISERSSGWAINYITYTNIIIMMISTIDLLFRLVDEEQKSLIMMMSINFISTLVILMQIVRLVEEERESLHSSLSEALTYLCSLGSTSPCSTR